MLTQINIPEELNKLISIEKVKLNFRTKQDTIEYILKQYFNLQ